MNKFSKIADGLAGWLTFELRAGRESLFCESYLAHPVGQLLKHQYTGRILAQVEHPLLSKIRQGSGKKPCVDFAVTGGDGKHDLVVETKWVSKSQTLLRDIIRDVVRLDFLVPNYTREAILVVAGKARDFLELFKNSQFQPHPDNLGSKHILPLGNHNSASIRFIPVPKFRSKLYSQVLSVYKGLEVSNSIPTERSGPFPRDSTANQYQVYIWKIKRFDTANKFKPEEHYQVEKERPQTV